VLIGVIVTTFSRQRLDAQLWSMSGFLAAQIGSYLVAYLVGFVMLPAVATMLRVDAATMQLLLSLPRLLIFFLVREALVALLWHSLLLRFDEPMTEVQP
jgi:TRAP-type mannitol/chloroaromatic compound transport system permease large subunit